tara:strand:+ start:192 stop:404 length:213 start_codon:yes stop_codon:yes gene_type:complete
MDIVEKRLEEVDFSQPLSLRNILRRSYIDGKQINKNLMLYSLYNSEKYRKVSPLEIGCGKYKVNVWAKVN